MVHTGCILIDTHRADRHWSACSAHARSTLLLYTGAEPRCKHAQPTSTLARLVALALRTHNFSAHQVLPLFCWLLQRCLRRLMSLPQAVNQPKFNQQRRDAQGCDAVSFARTLSFLHPTSAASTLTCQKLLPRSPC